METASMGGAPSGERAAKRLRLADNDSHVGNNSGIQLPPEVWVGVLKYVPFETVLTCGAVSQSMLRHVMPFLTALHIDQSSQMNVAVARRFRDVEMIHINSLLSLSIEMVDIGEGEEEYRDINVDHESSSRVVPFLSRFDQLQRVAFGVQGEDGKVLTNEAISSDLFCEGDEWYPNEGSRESMLQFLDGISIGYRCRALPKHLKISGLCCPDTQNRRVSTPCETCLRACRSFPVESVVSFECGGSSVRNARSGRFYGLDVCLERAQIESIIESRPGGPELLRSEERVLRLLSSVRVYRIGTDEPFYIAKYTKEEMDEIRRVIRYADLDANKIDPQKVTKAILRSFVGDINNATPPKDQCYVSEDSLGYLKETVGLCFSRDEVEPPLIHLADHALQISSVLAHCRGLDDDLFDVGSDDIEMVEIDCLRLLRRFTEEMETYQPIQDICESVTSLTKYLGEGEEEFQKDAARTLQTILSWGNESRRNQIIAGGAIQSFTRLLSASDDIIVASTIAAVRSIVTLGETKHIEAFATPEAITRCIALLASEHADVTRDSLGVLVAAGDHIHDGSDDDDNDDGDDNDGAGNVKALLPHLARIMKSPKQVDMLGDCSVLLRHLLGVDDPPIEAVIGSGLASRLVEMMAATDDEGLRANLAHIMLDLAHHHCQILSNPGGKKHNPVLVKEAGYLSTLLDLRNSPCNEIAEKAASTLQSIASSNVTEKWASWKEKKTLAWGEYEVTGELVDLLDEDDDAYFEEAEEVTDEHAKLEELQGAAAANRVQVDRPIIDTSNVSYAESPTLMGMPDHLLEKILHLAADPKTASPLSLEPVCKRLYKMLRGDSFWAYSTRKVTLNAIALHGIRKFQKRSENETLLVLCGEEGDTHVRGHDTIRTLSAHLLSKMIDSQTDQVPEVHFRLRGDAIVFLVEILEGYMVDKLSQALLAAIHSHRTEVKEEDVLFVFEKNSSPTSYGCEISPSTLTQPGVIQPFDFSRYLPVDDRGSGGDYHSNHSSSGIVWRWPEDNCCGVLPPEAGRRIIRRLAYKGGISAMNNDAFLAAEAEMLYAWGMLLADAYESSVEFGKAASYLKADDSLVYRKPSISADTSVPTKSSHSETDNTANEEQSDSLVRQLDWFKVPPPPFRVPRADSAEGEDCQYDTVHTIVPGLLEEAAERRDIGPSNVYGGGWISMVRQQFELEQRIEHSYYFGAWDEDFPEIYESGSDDDGQTKNSRADGQEANDQESNEVSS